MKKLVWWVQWHRRIGAVVALLLLMLGVTGILINHGQYLGWDRQPVYSGVLARLYGIPQLPPLVGFAAGDHWIVQAGDQLYLDQVAIQSCGESLLGAVQLPEMLAVLCGTRLLLLDEQGELIEQVSTLPAGGKALAQRDDQLLLHAAGGLFGFDDESAQWHPLDVAVNPQQARKLPAELATFFAEHTPVPGLTRERVLLDLHSGRLFGRAGVLVVNLSGLAVCLLAISGFLVWFGRRQRHRKR